MSGTRLSAASLAAFSWQGQKQEQGSKHSVAHEESPAEAAAGSSRFRWSRPQCVAVPRSTSPAGSLNSSQSACATTAATVKAAPSRNRSDSAPCSLRGGGNVVDTNPTCTSLPRRAQAPSQVLRTASCALSANNMSLANLASRGRALCSASERSQSDLDRDDSVGSAPSSVQSSIGMVRPTSAPGLHHEGWLSKRSSHKIGRGMAARWQNRYWTLQDCTLRYHKQRGGPPLRSFDLRRVRHIEIPEGVVREIELDFGFRVWRLRAESPEAARRWLLLLDAARLVGGNPLGEDAADATANWSDEDSAGSTRSTAESAGSGSRADLSVDPFSQTPSSGASLTSTPKGNCGPVGPRSGGAALSARSRGLLPSAMQQLFTPSPRHNPVESLPLKPPELLCASAIADRLEVDPDELDKRFEIWLGSSSGESTPHFGKAASATQPQRGLSEALAGLWMAFGGEGLHGAIAAWKGAQMPDPQGFADAADSLIGEYLYRMLRCLELWLQERDPIAEEVADMAAWFLFDVRPVLEQFESRSFEELLSNPFTSWRTTAGQLETLLLGEWETRSCDEIYQRVQAAYAMSGAGGEGEATSSSQTRADKVLEILHATLHRWRGHTAACDRAASVLIAALNAVLRCYRGYVRTLVDAPHSANAGGSCELAAAGPSVGKAKRQLNKVLSRLGKQERGSPSTPASRAAGAAAVAEAARLTSFCREAQVELTPAPDTDVCLDVLLAFAGAFEREGSQLCAFVAEAHFAELHRQTLKEISFGSSFHEASRLVGVCEVARSFLDETLANPDTFGSAQICDAVIRKIVQHWIRTFRRGPPRLASQTASSATISIDADMAELRQLSAQFGAEALWVSAASTDDPLQPLREVRQMLSDPSTENISLGAARLEAVLGVEGGAALASAVRQAIAR